jgi:hypothetical protein
MPSRSAAKKSSALRFLDGRCKATRGLHRISILSRNLNSGHGARKGLDPRAS